jgi:Spy/CpxP family protein refolding chaperone
VWQVLAGACVAVIVGAAVPAAVRIHASGSYDTAAAAVQSSSQAGQAGSSRGSGQTTGERKPGRPAPVSATAGWDWWNDADIRKQLNLSDEKGKKLQAIFQRRVTEVQPWVEKLNREREKLYHLTDGRMADEATYGMQVSTVELLAARVRETWTIMLYRMYRELTPDQYRKLQDIADQRMNEIRRRGNGPGR